MFATTSLQPMRRHLHTTAPMRTRIRTTIILAGVAACTLISIRLSAEAKGYPLERADVEVAFRRQPPEVEGGQADQITRTITLHGDLSDQEYLKLIRAANCAAYRNIVNGIPIITEPRR